MTALKDFIAAEIDGSAPEAARCLAAQIVQRGAPAAILFYGSGLWQMPGDDTLYDFYVLTDQFCEMETRKLPALLGRLCPPNVYYLEAHEGGRTLRGKYALLRLDQFAQAARGQALTPQIWARFAQPSRLLYARDAQARQAVIAALADAVITFHRHALPLVAPNAPPPDIWLTGLRATYAAELRSEKAGRQAMLYDAAASSFTARTALAGPVAATLPQMKMLPRPLLKLLAFLRLVKASFTFDGGVDYILWKIARQSGVQLTASDFQRRHPLLGGWPLLWQAWRRGGFR